MNEKDIAKIKVTEKRQSFPDKATPHFGLRVETNGRKSFYFYAKVYGRPRYKSLGEFPQTSLGEARAAARKLDVEVDEWKRKGYPADADPFRVSGRIFPGNAPTFAELIEAYIGEHVREKAKKPQEAEYRVRHFARKYFADWANKRLDSLSVYDLLKVKRDCGSHHVTANRSAEFIRRLINWSGREMEGKTNFWKFPKNFALEIELYDDENERKRYLKPEELAVFNAELAKEEHRDLRDCLVLSLVTGARKMDVYSMRWQDIDFDLRLWHVPVSTKVEPYNVQLLPAAETVLVDRKKQALSDIWVFPSRGKSGHIVDLKRAWTAFRKKCALKDFRWHDLRHTCASWQAIAGVSLQSIGSSLGHRSLQSTMRYSHLSDESVREGREEGMKKMQQMTLRAKRNNRKLLTQ